LHIWLPAAHPVAPSNVSALMSGVLIKTGIYGMTRVFSISSARRDVVGRHRASHRHRVRLARRIRNGVAAARDHFALSHTFDS